MCGHNDLYAPEIQNLGHAQSSGGRPLQPLSSGSPGNTPDLLSYLSWSVLRQAGGQNDFAAVMIMMNA